MLYFFTITGSNHRYSHEFFEPNMTVRLVKERAQLNRCRSALLKVIKKIAECIAGIDYILYNEDVGVVHIDLRIEFDLHDSGAGLGSSVTARGYEVELCVDSDVLHYISDPEQ